MDSVSNSKKDKMLVCIYCGSPAKELYRRYSETVLKLNQCSICGNTVDKYVEQDVVLILLDLLLLRLEAHRHVLFNSGLKSYWRLGVIFIICDAYYKWMIRRSQVGSDPNEGSDRQDFYDLEWSFYICLVQATVETFVFVGAVLLALKLSAQQERNRFQYVFVVKALMASFYGNVLVVMAIIWRLHLELSYIVLTKSFLFVSHLQVLQAATGMSFPLCLVAIVCGTLSQWSVGVLLTDVFFDNIDVS